MVNLRIITNFQKYQILAENCIFMILINLFCIFHIFKKMIVIEEQIGHIIRTLIEYINKIIEVSFKIMYYTIKDWYYPPIYQRCI